MKQASTRSICVARGSLLHRLDRELRVASANRYDCSAGRRSLFGSEFLERLQSGQIW
jgi:hypothetical protein